MNYQRHASKAQREKNQAKESSNDDPRYQDSKNI